MRLFQCYQVRYIGGYCICMYMAIIIMITIGEYMAWLGEPNELNELSIATALCFNFTSLCNMQ